MDSPERDVAQWWKILRAIGYELRPFSLPTRDDFYNFATATKVNVAQIVAEGQRLSPEVWKLLKNVDPYTLIGLCAWTGGWAFFIWLQFGAVYFIVSAMVVIFLNLGERGDSEWSAYSVFNAGCKAILGTINAQQFEREIMHQNPVRADQEEDREYVFVDQPDDRLGALDENYDSHSDLGVDDDALSEVGDDEGNAGANVAGAPTGARRVSGKRARRGYEERRFRQEERRLAALQGLGDDEW